MLRLEQMKAARFHVVEYFPGGAKCLCGWQHVGEPKGQIAYHQEVLAHFEAVKIYEEPKWENNVHLMQKAA